MTESPDLPLSPEDVEEIVIALAGSGFNGLDLTTSRFNLKIAGTEAGGWTQEWARTDTLARGTPAPVGAGATPKASAEIDGLISIRAPLPGTFYHAPQPGAVPFVRVGATVGKDTAVGIIETMKVMSSVVAGVAGEVVEMVVGDGQAVDRDVVLLRIRKLV
jgi:acetyl-CoA carboxylase biotin carboxyl carrier protein